ncbi:MAG: hypothetical protein CMJ83_01915 [Planctomycetes bacterium]|nr:hypothetical protein [Planctomycetota bacterium]
MRRVLLSGLWLGLMLGTLELGACAGFRIVDGEPFDAERFETRLRDLAGEGAPPTVEPGRAQGQSVLHSYTGFVFDRSAIVSRPRGERVNPLGFVDIVDPIQKRTPDRFVVAVVGGSVAWQLCAHGGKVLERELERIPSLAGRDAVLVRLGLGGYKQPQQVMVLNWLHALDAEFDAVLNLDGFNEVALPSANRDRGVHPFFPRRWDGLATTVPDREFRRRVGRLVLLEDERADAAVSMRRSWLRGSRLAALIWSVRDQHREQAIHEARQAIEAYQSKALPFVAVGPGIEGWTNEDFYPRLADLWERGSRQLSEICHARGMRYYHFLQPNQYVVDSKPMDEAERAVALGKNRRYRTGVREGYPLLIERGARLRANGVPFFDLTRMFANVRERVYDDDCCHFTLDGYARIAHRIGELIAATEAELPPNAVTRRVTARDLGPAPGDRDSEIVLRLADATATNRIRLEVVGPRVGRGELVPLQRRPSDQALVRATKLADRLSIRFTMRPLPNGPDRGHAIFEVAIPAPAGNFRRVSYWMVGIDTGNRLRQSNRLMITVH